MRACWTEQVDELISVETATVVNRERVGYRYRLSNPDGSFLCEQQAYLSERDGRIGWLRLVCSGSRPMRANQMAYDALKPSATIASSTWTNFKMTYRVTA